MRIIFTEKECRFIIHLKISNKLMTCRERMLLFHIVMQPGFCLENPANQRFYFTKEKYQKILQKFSGIHGLFKAGSDMI